MVSGKRIFLFGSGNSCILLFSGIYMMGAWKISEIHSVRRSEIKDLNGAWGV